MIFLSSIISTCNFGISKFKIFYNDIAVAVIEVNDSNVCYIIDQDLQVKKYNIQTIDNETVMFVYC